MRPSEIIARQRRELNAVRAQNAVLKGQLLAQGLRPIDMSPWAGRLLPSAAAVMTALVEAQGRVLDRCYLEARIPQYDHAEERDWKIVDVHVCEIRKALGRDAVETVWGVGYRCGARFLRRQGASPGASSR